MLDQILKSARPMTLDPFACEAIEMILDFAYNESENSKTPLGICLAAAFDLLVSAEYYQAVSHRGWIYCSENPTMLIYPFTNICPRCVGKGEFIYAKSNKPESGQIGTITVELLCQMLKSVFRRGKHNVEVYKASEPIDVIISVPQHKCVIIAEVKAAPLLTLPLAVYCEPQTETVEGELVSAKHSLSDNPFIKEVPLFILFPQTAKFEERIFPLELHWDAEKPFLRAINMLLSKEPSFFSVYLNYWIDALNAYENKDRTFSAYWLTNGCGQPSPRPETWPKRSGSGFESVSDAKTSVGMDRTDDIKKGIYQVLKLGADYKPRAESNLIKTALISNIHAVRHYDEYLLTLRDIIWAIDEKRSAKVVSDLDPNTSLYNLFDGILSFTQCDIRDEIIKELFNFE